MSNEILKALDSINQELLVIGKDQKGFGYNFRGIDDAINTLGPLLKKNNVIVSREVVSFESGSYKDAKDKHVNTVTAVFKYNFTSTKDGSVLTTEGIGSGEDRGDKHVACAISNSYKYAIFELFTIATKEMQDSDQKYAKENQGSGVVKKVVKEENKEVVKKKRTFKKKGDSGGL